MDSNTGRGGGFDPKLWVWWPISKWTMPQKLVVGFIGFVILACVVSMSGGEGPAQTAGRNAPASPTNPPVVRPPTPSNLVAPPAAPPPQPTPAPQAAQAEPPIAVDSIGPFVAAHLNGAQSSSIVRTPGAVEIRLALERTASPSQFIHRAGDVLRDLVTSEFWAVAASPGAVRIRFDDIARYMVVPLTASQPADVLGTTDGSADVMLDLAHRRYWSAPDVVVFRDHQPCPDGLWSVFPGDAPGEDEFARHESASHRAELATRIRSTRFLLAVNDVNSAQLGNYNFSTHSFTLTLYPDGDVVACTNGDAGGSAQARSEIAIGLNSARSVDMTPGNDGLVGFHTWEITPLRFRVSVPQGDAEEFAERHRNTLNFQMGWRVGGARIDRRMARDQASRELDDYGAGRLIQATAVAVRVYNRDTEEILVDTSPTSQPRRENSRSTPH